MPHPLISASAVDKGNGLMKRVGIVDKIASPGPLDVQARGHHRVGPVAPHLHAGTSSYVGGETTAVAKRASLIASRASRAALNMHRPIRMPAGAVDNATGTIMVVGIVDKITFLLKLRTSPAPLEIEARCRQRVGAVASHRCQKTHSNKVGQSTAFTTSVSLNASRACRVTAYLHTPPPIPAGAGVKATGALSCWWDWLTT